MVKILFICHGNICRSAMAEFVMKDIVKKNGKEADYEIASAATSREEIGNPVYPPVQKILNENGIDCSGKYARQMTKADYKYYDMIICMDHYNVRNLSYICDDLDGKVSLLLDRDVADPWYTRNFKETWDDINEGCQMLYEETSKPTFGNLRPI